MVLDCLPPNCLNVQYPHVVIIPFLDLQVFKLGCPLTHGTISRLSPVIFHFLCTLVDKMSNFFAVIAPAFVLVHSFAGNPRTLYVWAVVKPALAPKSPTRFKVLVLVCTVSLVTPVIKILTPRSECSIVLILSVDPYILCTLALVSK